MGMAAAAVGSSAAGGALANAMGGNSSNNSLSTALQGNANYINSNIGNINSVLQQGLGNAISAVDTGTTNAVNSQNQYLNQALTGATGISNAGFAQAQALDAPYQNIALNATDQYADSLGVARPAMGSAALQQALSANPQNQTISSAYQNAAQAYGIQPGQTANAPATFTQQAPSLSNYQNLLATPDFSNYNTDFSLLQSGGYNPGQLAQYQDAATSVTSPSHYSADFTNGNDRNAALAQGAQAAQNIFAQQQQNATNSAYGSAMNTYNTALNAYNTQNGLFNNVNSAASALTPQIIAQLQAANGYNSGLFNTVRANV